MHRQLYLVPLLALPVGCDGTLLTIQVTESARTTVEGGGIVGDLVGGLGFDGFFDMDITSSEELQNQGVGPGDVQEVRLTLFELEALEPAGADLSFLSSMQLDVEAPDIPSARMASASEFPEGEAVVVFELDEVDLTDYVVSQSMTITTDVTGSQPSDDTLVEARFSLDVGVTTQGARNYR